MNDDHDVTFTEEMTGELELVVVRPGDVLVLSASADVDPDTAARVKDRLLQQLPELAGAVVLLGMRFEFVYRSDEP